MSDFREFPKISRLNRDIVVTEKIDGTNASVVIEPSLTVEGDPDALLNLSVGDVMHSVRAGARNGYRQPGKGDNFGFAAWTQANAVALVSLLGPGRHFGEWWGLGINRGYGLAEKRFSLFNVSKWGWLNAPEARAARPDIPAQVWSVPVLYRGPWFQDVAGMGPVWAPEYQIGMLRRDGSRAVPAWTKPEGIVVFHEASSQLFKATLEKDEKHKSEA